jgi:hypothetical protein
MSEWINPRYKGLVAAWKRAQQTSSRESQQRESPVRGFIFPSKA